MIQIQFKLNLRDFLNLVNTIKAVLNSEHLN